jgi:ABC-type Mn2+/Zn2+ transport system permease subunit
VAAAGSSRPTTTSTATTMTDVLAPFHEGFVRLALAELALIGIAAAGVGCWIVLHGLSYAAESLSHAIFPGLVAAGLLGIPLVLGGAGGALVAAAAIAAVGSVRGLDRDLGTAVVVTTAFGGGVLLALSPATPRGLNAVLFGDALAVEPQDLVVTAAVVAALIVALVMLHHRLLAVGFDRGAAALIGARPRATEVALLICIAAAVVVGTQALGSLLVVAILVAPAATARLVARRLPAMFAVAAAVALTASVVGIELSYHAGLAAGASIALCLVGAYLVAVALAPRAVGARTA